jgi:outer membrane protein assembly factor BamE
MQLRMLANFYVHLRSDEGFNLILRLRYDAGINRTLKRIMAAVTLKSLRNWCIAICCTLSVTACSNWIYRIDIPQGNFLEQKDIDKLRINMTKEQVQYVLGNPVAENSFDDNIWHYFYSLKGGRGDNFEKKLVINFTEGKLSKMSGDFDMPKNFNVPLDQ